MSRLDADCGDKYRLIKKIGAGTYGTAWLAQNRHEVGSKDVVVKRVSLEGLGRREIQDSIKEAQLMELLEHPNIISHVEHFKDDQNYLCIVTKLADKGDLQAKVKEAQLTKAHFPEETIWGWFIQLCCAIKHVHDRKILHRDIKSANIFLNEDVPGEEPRVKLGDFGIAKVLEHTADVAKTAVGTPYYMSPELCQNKQYNNKSDVWACGCVLYELCTLRQPFDAHNFNALCVKILRGKYEAIPKMYSKDLSTIVTLCLEQQASRRPDINKLLDMPQLRDRLQVYSKLNPTVIRSEFSHTVLHDYNAKDEMLTPRGGRKPPAHPAQQVAPPRRSSASQNAGAVGGDKARRPSKGKTPQEIEEAIRLVREQTKEILQTVEALTPRSRAQPPPVPKRPTPREPEIVPVASTPASSEKFVWGDKTLKLEGNSKLDTVHSRVENLRLFVEKGIGEERFLKAYRLMCSVSEDDDEDKLEGQLLHVVGKDRAEYLNAICQLIFCEDRTFDQEHVDADGNQPVMVC